MYWFFPKQLENHPGPAKVVMILVTDKEPYYMHAHTLLVNKEPVHGCHVFDIKPEDKGRLELKAVAIQHFIKDFGRETLMDRILQTEYFRDVTTSNSYLPLRTANEIEVDRFVDSLRDCTKHIKRDQLKKSDYHFYERRTQIEVARKFLRSYFSRAVGAVVTFIVINCTHFGDGFSSVSMYKDNYISR